jgi:Ca-activated chloride channel homolog
MKKYIFLILLITHVQMIVAQSANDYLQQGNALYNTKKYDEAIVQYQKITENNTYKNTELAKANYNKGNAYAKLKKWQEAVDSYTKSLAQKPTDANAKYNLCYAKRKLEKEQQNDKKKQEDKNKDKDNKDKQDPKDKQEKKEKKEEKKDEGKQDQQQKPEQQQGKAQPSKLTKQQAEQYLKALKEEEKKLMQKKMKGKEGGAKLGKDW